MLAGARLACESRARIDSPRRLIKQVDFSDPEARFHDLGADFYDNRTGPERKKRNHIRPLEALGYKVTLEPTA